MQKILSAILMIVALGMGASFAEAEQSTKVPRIGWLTVGPPTLGHEGAPFLQGLHDLGYVEGKNIAIEFRAAKGRVDRLPELARELVRLNVDVIVALEPPSLYAVMAATKTIPIVMRSTSDPVKTGIVASLARPGGNVTGVSSYATDLTGKRLQLLKDVIPGLSQVAVLFDPTVSGLDPRLKEAEPVARSLGLRLQPVEARTPADFGRALQAATQGKAGAFIVLRNPLFVLHHVELVQAAAKSGLPAIYDEREFADAGGLMSYGADLAQLHRRAAYYVDKILKGAKPGDLPIEQPIKFELVVNLKAAKALSLTIPPELLTEADVVIQ